MQMRTITLAGKTVKVDEVGCLVNRSDWNEEIAKAMARADNLELTPDHWKVINCVRDYYDEHRIVPAMRVLTETIAKKAAATSIRRLADNGIRKFLYMLFPYRYEQEALHEASEKYTTKYLYELFPQGPAKSARKYAGLPMLTYEVDVEGFLENPSDWTEEVAAAMAKADNFELTPEHWEVIKLMREYYDVHHTWPDVRVLIRIVSKKFGPEKGNSKYLYELFPQGAKQANKYAGLPKPHGQI